MATQAQIDANIQNAALSTGPRTPEGKAIVSRNRVSHGLTGQHIVLPDEDPQAYDQLLESYLAEHNPQGPTALFLVRTLAQSQWKLDRIARLEAAILARDSGALSDELLRLSRYETATRRVWANTLKQLTDLRKVEIRAQQDARAAETHARKEDEKRAEAECLAMLGGPLPRLPRAVHNLAINHPEFFCSPRSHDDEPLPAGLPLPGPEVDG